MKLKLKKILTSCLLALIFIFSYVLLKSYLISLTEKSTIVLNKNWDITINSKEYKNVNLDNFTFPVTNKGDIIVMKRKLPQTTSIKHGMILFRTYHSTIDAYLNNELIYEYGKDLHKQNKMVGSGYYWFELNDNYQNKELKIVLNVTENKAFSNLEEILLEDESDCIKNLIISNLIEIIICLFLFVIGICCLGVLIYMKTFDKEHRILFWISLFSIIVSLWKVCGYAILEVLTSNHSMMAHIEFLSLYIVPIPILLFLNESRCKKYLKLSLRILITINITFVIISIGLNELNIVHYPGSLEVFHLLMLVETIILFIFSINQIKEKNSMSQKVLLRGIVILAIFIIVDLARFNISKFLKMKDSIASSSIMPIGFMIFIVSMFGSYIYNMIDFYCKTAEKRTLLQMAFTDALTKIGNRTKCEDLFSKLEDKKIPLSIINFDLNNFKHVNDTYGHVIGDKLLVDFAKILNENYKNYGFVGRMGGDEFIVVLENNDEEYILESIRLLQEKINEENDINNNEFNISTAYGYETNKHNINRSIWNMYEVADKKMYQCKEEIKSRE